MENYKNWLGKKVNVVIDRPIGSTHPVYKNMIYQLNYGYVPGVISEFDDEEIDAYIMGVDKIVTKYYGQVIAVIKRQSGDKEIKLVVAENSYPKEQIIKAVNFQEQYFQYELSTL